jgi:hypothetical protein
VHIPLELRGTGVGAWSLSHGALRLGISVAVAGGGGMAAEVGCSGVDYFDALLLMSKATTHFSSGLQIGSAGAAMSSYAFRRLVDTLEIRRMVIRIWTAVCGRNKITNFTPRISLSTPRITPRDANKPPVKSEGIFVNVFVNVYIHTEKVSRVDNE